MQKLNTKFYKSDKANNLKTAKINYPGSVAYYDTRPGNEVGLFYNDNTHGPRNPHDSILLAILIDFLLDVL